MECLQFTTADLNRYNNLSHSEIGHTRLPNYWETTQEENEDILQCNPRQLTVEEIAYSMNMDNTELLECIKQSPWSDKILKIKKN